ncbi:ribonuclease HII [Candidatus Sumerlaeota bacterium]|nr:ribonuclease HII [Candidatus Sumerlaeota bacterium]
MTEALYQYDQAARERTGCAQLAGVDEAGRGPLAGPVVAAAAILPPEARFDGLNDSKQVPEERREELYDEICARAIAWGVGIAEADEIDRINILQATLRAAQRALSQLQTQPDHIISDYLKIPDQPCAVEAIKKGDATSASVAAASILAKVTRDRLMRRYDVEWPEYGFAAHKGYAAAAHKAALLEHGPCSIHRFSFNGVCFFETEPRRSKTFQQLTTMKENSSPDLSGEFKTQIESAIAHLPRVEHDLLQNWLR